MTRRYSLQRLQKDVLLGVSGVTLAGTMLFSGSPTANAAVQTQRNNRESISKTVNQIKRAEKASLKMQKKNALREENFLE